MQTLTAIVRATGRIVAGSLLLLAALMLFGHAGDWKPLTIPEARQFAVFVVCVIGFLIQALPPWRQHRRAAWGGAISLLATVAFFLMNYNNSGQWPGGWVFPLFFVPGVAELVAAVFGRKQPSFGFEPTDSDDTPDDSTL